MPWAGFRGDPFPDRILDIMYESYAQELVPPILDREKVVKNLKKKNYTSAIYSQ